MTTAVEPQHHTLAQRLIFGGDSVWLTEVGWQARMVFAWMRLVRAGKVCRARRAQPMWQAAERNRTDALVAAYGVVTEAGRDERGERARAVGGGAVLFAAGRQTRAGGKRADRGGETCCRAAQPMGGAGYPCTCR